MYADQLEADVWTDVCAALRNPDNMIGDLLSFVKTGEGEIGAELNRLKRDVDRCRSEEARYLRLFGLDQIDQQLLLEQIGPIKALREEHERCVAQLEEQQRLSERVDEVELQLREYCARLAVGLDDLDWDGKRETLAAFGVRVEGVKDSYKITASIQPWVATIERTLA